MSRKTKSILIILLVVVMLVLITGVAVAGRPKTGNGKNNQNFLYTCGDWAAVEPFFRQGNKIGNGMCPGLY